MAKVKFGALVQDARGKLGGIVYARNRAGSYSRQKVSPTNPGTDRQLAVRATFTALSQAWRALDDPQRAQWRVWADNHPFSDVFGDSRILAGHAAYLQLNATRALFGLAALADPPPDDSGVTGPLVESVSVDATEGEITVTLTEAADANDLYAVWCTPGLSVGVSFPGSRLRLVYAAKPGAVDTWTVTPADFNPAVVFTAGQKVIAYVVRYSQTGL